MVTRRSQIWISKPWKQRRGDRLYGWPREPWKQRLNADTSDHAGPQLPCSCGAPAQYSGHHEKTFESVLGALHLERAYYHCATCQSGFCPRDHALRLELFSLTPGVLRMTASTAALVSFQEGSSLLHELAGVEVSVSQVQRAAETLGTEIAADERACVDRMGEVAPTMYLGMDGTGVPMRAAEVAGRAGKQPDGSAKTREAKLVTVWTAEARDEDGKPTRDPGSITYSAGIESAAVPDTSPTRSELAERVLREATRRGFTEAPRCAVLGDGSLWIWNTARPGSLCCQPVRYRRLTRNRFTASAVVVSALFAFETSQRNLAASPVIAERPGKMSSR